MYRFKTLMIISLMYYFHHNKNIINALSINTSQQDLIKTEDNSTKNTKWDIKNDIKNLDNTTKNNIIIAREDKEETFGESSKFLKTNENYDKNNLLNKTNELKKGNSMKNKFNYVDETITTELETPNKKGNSNKDDFIESEINNPKTKELKKSESGKFLNNSQNLTSDDSDLATEEIDVTNDNNTTETYTNNTSYKSGNNINGNSTENKTKALQKHKTVKFVQVVFTGIILFTVIIFVLKTLLCIHNKYMELQICRLWENSHWFQPRQTRYNCPLCETYEMHEQNPVEHEED